MGRTLLSSEANHSTLQTSPLPLPLLASFIAFLAYALCASHTRKLSKQSPRPQPPSSESSSTELAPNPPTGTEGKKDTAVVPATHGPICPTTPAAPSSTPRRKLTVSLSIKLPEGLSRVLTGRREAAEKEMKEELESVWTKTIILGEKCKVPEDDEEEEEGEVVLYDENGNRQRIYHPRTPRSMPISRTNSFVNAEIIPVS